MHVVQAITKLTCDWPVVEGRLILWSPAALKDGVRCSSQPSRGEPAVGPSFSYHVFESPLGLLTTVDAVAFGSDSLLGAL